MMTKFHKLLPLVLLSIGLFLAACEQQTPLYVYVTPTPIPQIGALNVPTGTPSPIPTVGAPPATSDQPAVATLVPTVVPTISANATIIGPIIGPNYTLPPTSTQRPTMTPTDAPTATPGGPTDEPDEPDATVGPRPTALPALDAARIGIQLDPNLDQDDWGDAVGRRVDDDLTFGWIKIQMAWEDLQPNAPDEFGEPFQRLEQYLQFADREGLNILVSVAKAPAWARSNQNEDGPPDDPARLASFMTFMLGKFPFIDAVEIWNEPNLRREWQGTLPFNGAGYMRLFTPSYQAIRAISPNIVIVSAGLAPTGNNDGSRDDRQYLSEMYANGLAQYDDIGIGAHPYSWGNSPDATCCGTRGWDDDPHFFFADTIREYREIMTANGQGDNDMWITEFGWATWDQFPGGAPEAWMAFNDRWAQGNYTIRAFQIIQQTENMGPAFLWNLNFAVLGNLVESSDERAAYSIVVPLQPMERPLYWMLYDAVRPDTELETYD